MNPYKIIVIIGLVGVVFNAYKRDVNSTMWAMGYTVLGMILVEIG